MKTKQLKEEPEKGIDEETVIEPKTRARKKASDVDDDKKSNQEDPKPSKEVKKLVTKPKAVVKKRPLGIRKTLRGKKPGTVAKDKVKTVIRQAVKRGRKPGKKLEATNTQDKETVPLIPASEIKKEPTDDSPNSRSSSPKTAGRRQRLSSDMIMMKTMLGDSPNNLVLGPRTSPYSMRSERSNSPSMFEGKKLRSGKPRKIKNNLLSEVVLKEQKKRRRLYSDSKTSLDTSETAEDCKKFKRGRSCSRDGSEISKCSDNTESDLSMSETLTDADNSRELNKKLDKSKTDLDIDIENNVQISTIEKVPSLNVDSKPAEAEPSSVVSPKDKKKLSLQRSTSLDSDNNNSNRLKIEKLNSTEIENKISKTDNSLLEARSSILTSMSKTFNSLEVTKNIRKARRGRKAAVTPRPAPSVAPSTAAVEVPPVATVEASLVAPVTTETCTITAEPIDDKIETIDTLTKEINDLINDLDQNINSDHQMATESIPTDSTPDQMQTKTVSKFYGLAKPVNNENEVPTAATPVKSKDMLTFVSNENTPSKSDDGENIRLHYEEDSVDKPAESTKPDIPFKVASIDKLMDRLKEFEEFDKRRQMESKTTDTKPMMVTNDVVLIPKFGEVKPLKDIQSVRSPEKPIEKENVFSSLENNAAISIVKRDHVRKSIDIDLPNSVTLIKRNSFSSRKESTSSNHSRESDAISLFEKSLGKDVTLTELRKSVDKSAPSTQVDLHQFATLHPNGSSTLGLDSSQISITPRVVDSKINNEVQIISKRKSRGSMSSRKSSESLTESEEKMATIEKIKSPIHHSSAISITAASAGKLEAALPAKSPDPVAMKSPEPVAIKSPEFPPVAIKSPSATPIAMKSPESTPIETEALPPPEESIKPAQSEPSEVSNAESALKTEAVKDQTAETPVEDSKEAVSIPDIVKMDTEIHETAEKAEEPTIKEPKTEDIKPEEKKPVTRAKPSKSPKLKSARNSTEQPGPSNMILETPESQKRKENVLRTLGLLTHKAANEAKIEKLKEKERIYGSNLAMMKSKGAKSSGDYTGTLKTVIKLNRGGDKKRHKSSLKMTFQKTKYRGKPAMELGEAAAEDDAYYTIERREGAAAISDGGHRKSHYSNRLNSHDTETAPEPVEPKETLNLVIPEKASSFSIHPGRLCMDQCFYCGGKFGLFDTPCHIAQIKSSDRQKKILDNEEKLTIDSCLCDACYRHVDRRANCPSYRKRPPGKQPQDILTNISPPPIIQSDKPPSPMEEDSEEAPQPIAGRVAVCHTKDCTAPAVNSIRRKVLIKLRSSVNKLLKLKGDYPGLHTIPLCGAHYAVLEPLLACALCRRRLAHQHVHVLRGYIEINPLLKAANIPVEFTERPVICKNCQYYCTLLQRPGANNVYCNGYRRRLLLTYNVELPAPTELETEDQSDDSKSKKKRPKSKQRKSTDPTDKTEAEISESSERTSESTPEKEKIEDSEEQNRIEPLEEDIESLISSNKILVPNAKSNETPSDGSEADQLGDMEQLLPIDKQTELQYLLQKQNNPAQFLQKQRNLLKIQNVGIQKPGLQQRIQDKNAKRIHKLGQLIVHKDKMRNECYEEPVKDGIPILKNISLNDECTIETITNKKPADIATLKNKWVTSESFTQVKKNLSELSKSGKKPEGKYSNPVKRLETNPSISVRELFPGEEEMNLQCNIEFNNVKGVTPEGWEKCNTLIQYDVETKKLWNELQRPYGNQSSFLRHLIILEKYFRSGELVLSHNATPHAANYSDSVQSRLRAYDNIVNDTPRRSEPAISLIEFRKKPSMNGKSLLKSNQSEEKKMPPPKVKSAKVDKAKSKALPPELIAINTPNAQGRKAIQNVLHNIQQLVKGVSASDPTEIASAPLPPPLPPPLPKLEVPKEKKEPQKEKKDTPKKEEGSKKTKTSSKPWRPTLMPITQENLVRIAREPVQVAVDGRNLPSLVQVMSSGKRYHITLQDYNKMCIMRREKLQQLQDGDKPKRHSIDDTTVVTEIQPSAMLGNGGTVLQNIITEEKSQDKKDMPELTQIGSNAANILKNVGLKNITIAPITPKTATMTSQSVTSPIITSPSLIMTSTPLKIPQLGPAVSIMSETILSPSMITSHMIMPKIPKSLTVIPQTVVPISSPTPTEVPRP